MTAGSFDVEENAERLYVKRPEGIAYAGATTEVGVRPASLRVAARPQCDAANSRSCGTVALCRASVVNSRNLTLDHITVTWMAYWLRGIHSTTDRQSRSVTTGLATMCKPAAVTHKSSHETLRASTRHSMGRSRRGRAKCMASPWPFRCTMP